MDTLDTVRDWAPTSPSAIVDRASDAFDVDLADIASDVVDVAGDLVEAAGEGIVAAVAATEVASRATFRVVRRHPVLTMLVAGALVAGVLLLVGKRRRSQQDDATTPLSVAA